MKYIRWDCVFTSYRMLPCIGIHGSWSGQRTSCLEAFGFFLGVTKHAGFRRRAKKRICRHVERGRQKFRFWFSLIPGNNFSWEIQILFDKRIWIFCFNIMPRNPLLDCRGYFFAGNTQIRENGLWRLLRFWNGMRLPRCLHTNTRTSPGSMPWILSFIEDSGTRESSVWWGNEK